jgi:hypothetical protein
MLELPSTLREKKMDCWAECLLTRLVLLSILVSVNLSITLMLKLSPWMGSCHKKWREQNNFYVPWCQWSKVQETTHSPPWHRQGQYWWNMKREDKGCKLCSELTCDWSHRVADIYSRCIGRHKGQWQRRHSQIKEANPEGCEGNASWLERQLTARHAEFYTWI